MRVAAALSVAVTAGLPWAGAWADEVVVEGRAASVSGCAVGPAAVDAWARLWARRR